MRSIYVGLLALGIILIAVACGYAAPTDGPVAQAGEEDSLVRPEGVVAVAAGSNETTDVAQETIVEAVQAEADSAQEKPMAETQAEAEAVTAEVMAEAENEQTAMETDVMADEAMETTMSEKGDTMTPAMTEKSGPTEAQRQLLANLPNAGPAPELTNDVWLNSEPLRLAELRGKVVIVEFWTYACINCIRTVPAVRELYNTYSQDELVIIGVHTPEFSFEKEVDNVKTAVVDLDVPFPVAIDNDWKTWRSFGNRYWPAQYVIDKAGNIRHLKIGEVHVGTERYEEYRQILDALIAEEVS